LVAGHVVVEQDAVAAEHVAGLRTHAPRTGGGVELGERGVLEADAALGLQLGEAQADQLHAGDVGHHARELVLDELEAGERPAELLAAANVGERALVRGDRVPEPFPRDRLAALRQDAAGVGERAGVLEAVLERDAHA
jgi:hypothetical protein